MLMRQILLHTITMVVEVLDGDMQNNLGELVAIEHMVVAGQVLPSLLVIHKVELMDWVVAEVLRRLFAAGRAH